MPLHPSDKYRPKFQPAPFGVDSVYHTFKENLAKGYSIDQIREVLEENQLEADEISSGLRRLLFTVSQFIKSQEAEQVATQDTQRYLLEHGYTMEIIKLAYLKLNQTHH